MLNQQTTQKPDAVENFFCKPFGELKRHPMNEEISEYMTKLSLMSKLGANNHPLPDEEKPHQVKVIESFLKHRFTFEIKDNSILLFISILFKSFGDTLMYMTYIQYRLKQQNQRELTWYNFVRIFPNGFPSEQDLEKAWIGQKVQRGKDGGSDNLLDYQSAMLSIHFLEEKE